jgi:hypothetical protein
MAEEEATRSLGKRGQAAQREIASGPSGEAPSARESEEEAVRAADAQNLIRRLAGKPSAEILARISNGDPLRLYPLVVRRIREASYLLDPDRAFERMLAEVAVGLQLEAQCSEPGWIIEKADAAIRSVLERDSAQERDGIPPERPEEYFRLFVESFFIEPPLARLSSVRFNGLEERIRKGFQKLIIEALPLDEVLAMGLGPPERLQLDILLGLKAIGLLDDDGVEELRWKGDKP